VASAIEDVASAIECHFWTGPDWKGPVQDCQSVVQSDPKPQVDRTVPSPTPDRVRPEW
jgi:hypothetical protein